ncbi:hypothetical protein NS283_09575 [Microbacterium testaceum]|nr:hypothetical protein NS283_09575 [Microbacterium testaceum]
MPSTPKARRAASERSTGSASAGISRHDRAPSPVVATRVDVAALVEPEVAGRRAGLTETTPGSAASCANDDGGACTTMVGSDRVTATTVPRAATASTAVFCATASEKRADTVTLPSTTSRPPATFTPTPATARTASDDWRSTPDAARSRNGAARTFVEPHAGMTCGGAGSAGVAAVAGRARKSAAAEPRAIPRTAKRFQRVMKCLLPAGVRFCPQRSH